MHWKEDQIPRAVWEHFYQLTQVPRPSLHEERISAFLPGFGHELGLETEVDDVGDVLNRKPASDGMEVHPGESFRPRLTDREDCWQGIRAHHIVT